MYGTPHALVPTYEKCFLQDTNDAILIIQAVIDKLLPVTRSRPTEQNRKELIRSGNVFVIDMAEHHISRWTDGLTWSPSRILGDFLLYREKRKRANSNRGSSGGLTKKVRSNSGSQSSSQHEIGSGPSPMMSSFQIPFAQSQGIVPRGGETYLAKDMDSAFHSHQIEPSSSRTHSAGYNLYGSLTNNDQYKEDGLIKKTFSIAHKNTVFRLISYYVPKDVEAGKLRIPSQDPTFADVQISNDLLQTKAERMPLSVPQGGFHPLTMNDGAPPQNEYYARFGNPPERMYGTPSMGGSKYADAGHYDLPDGTPHPAPAYGNRGMYLGPERGSMGGNSQADYHRHDGYDRGDQIEQSPNFRDSPGMQDGMLPRPRSHSYSAMPNRHLSFPYGASQTPRQLNRAFPTSTLPWEQKLDMGTPRQMEYAQPPYGNHESFGADASDSKLKSKHSLASSTSSIASSSAKSAISSRQGDYHERSPTEGSGGFNRGAPSIHSNIYEPISPGEINPLQGTIGQAGGISASVISQDSDVYGDHGLNELPNEEGQEFYEPPSGPNQADTNSDYRSSTTPQNPIYVPSTTTASYNIPRY